MLKYSFLVTTFKSKINRDVDISFICRLYTYYLYLNKLIKTNILNISKRISSKIKIAAEDMQQVTLGGT